MYFFTFHIILNWCQVSTGTTSSCSLNFAKTFLFIYYVVSQLGILIKSQVLLHQIGGIQMLVIGVYQSSTTLIPISFLTVLIDLYHSIRFRNFWIHCIEYLQIMSGYNLHYQGCHSLLQYLYCEYFNAKLHTTLWCEGFECEGLLSTHYS